MGWEAWVTLATILLMAVALVRNMAGPDTVLLGGVAVLMTFGAVPGSRFPAPREMVAGFGNEGLIAIAALFVVAAGLSQTGAMSRLTEPLLGRPRSLVGAQVRLMVPVAALSAFLNNTPIVAMFTPVVTDWCRRTGLVASKLFIPLSYAAIMGGTCSLIGTSTNVVVHGLVESAADNSQLRGVDLGMFTIAAVGVPVTLIGIVYLLLASPKLLPNRSPPVEDHDGARRYTVEMLVESASSIDGKTIEQAGLRRLPGVYLMEIERNGERLVAVGPEQVLHARDRLIFVGVVDSVVDLQKTRGLVPATDQVFKLAVPRPDRCLVEAVVSDQCPLVGKTIREGRFRTAYNGAIIAVHRGGRHLNQKIGDIVLRSGDTLLIETQPQFVEHHRNSRDFFLTSAVAGSRPPRHDRAGLALAILAAIVALISTESLVLVNAALLGAALMVLGGCCSPSEARSSINWRILLAIGSAIGIGQTLFRTGAADALAAGLMALVADMGPHGVLAGIYLITLLFNMTIGHIGAAVLVFPIALATAAVGVNGQSLSFMPFVITIMMAASADFANPISYPTHLMVYGAGGYRFTDYVRIGLPLNLLVMIVTVTLAPMVWPFY